MVHLKEGISFQSEVIAQEACNFSIMYTVCLCSFTCRFTLLAMIKANH